MPVVNKPTSKALVPQPESSLRYQTEGQSELTTAQPRQPTSLQGLLRFAMETTRAEDAPHNSELHPMDEERRQFLENALKSMTVDLVEVLQKQIEILKKVENVSEDDIPECSNAIETVLEYIDNIDIANDFHKIGGFMVLYPCLKCQHPKIQAGGCELLAVLCQNNPYCQQIVLDNEFIPMLLRLIEKNEDRMLVTKALYALGSIVRDSEEGYTQLTHCNGLTILLNTILKSPEEKFITKTTFLLSALCRQHPDLKGQLFSLGYLPCLISLISKDRTESHEHVLALLVALVEDNPEAIMECVSSKYNLKDILHRYISSVRNKEECQEEEAYCRRLLPLLNSR